MANANSGKAKAQGGIIRYARCSVSPDQNDHADTKFYISDTSVDDASSSDFEPELSPPRNMKKEAGTMMNNDPSIGSKSGECQVCDFSPTPVVCNECDACEDQAPCDLMGVSLGATLPSGPCLLDPAPKTSCRRQSQRRCRPLYGNSPNCKFGPKASVMKNQAAVLTIQDPGSQRLIWYKPPQSVLIIKKVFDDTIIQPFKQIVTWLVQEKEMEVYVEKKVLDNRDVSEDTSFLPVRDKLFTFQEGKDDLTDKIDLIICLGGDGTLLYASSIFQKSVPPVMAFHLGSLGFLTPFESSHFAEQVHSVLQGNVSLTLRTRLKCVVLKKDSECSQIATIKHMESKKQILVLNEVVIDRGSHPYLCNLDLYIEGAYITSVQGDGLIISTPTGSTAYAAGAGASMVHPNVPAILITPICPHSLSFRPIVVPAGVEVKVMVSPDARNNAWVSFDGRNREEIVPGDNLRVTTSIYPIPSICREDQTSDWFTSLATCLHWNVRKQQQAFLPPTGSMESIESWDSLNSANGNSRDPNHGRLL